MSKTIAERLADAGVDPAKAKETEAALQSSGGEGRYWNHKEEPHATFVGTVTSVWSRPGYKGVGTDPGVAIETDTETVKISNGLTAWKNAVARENPAVGDVVVFEATGYPAGKAYVNINFRVAQRGNSKAVDNGEAPF